MLPAIVVLELLPSVDEPLSDEVAGGPPIAVVPVEGVVLVALPGVVGPANALDVLLPGVVPVLFVPATFPVVGDAGVFNALVVPGVPVPSVLPGEPELSADGLVVLPQGAASGAPDVVPDVVPELVCASATPAPIASATAPRRCAK